MDQDLEDNLELALAEAEQAIDPATEGLLDRGDCQRLIAKLSIAVRRLLEAHRRFDGARESLPDCALREPPPAWA